MEATSPDQIIEELFLRFLTRYPTEEEVVLFRERFARRVCRANRFATVVRYSKVGAASQGHLLQSPTIRSESNWQEQERRVRQGPGGRSAIESSVARGL